ncbi:Alpha/beta hydrolase family-domain-containing protein [Podospora appendiculata]|uniref:Alpha/beta hydrolase family-domain-containing protein n=1 Tax=Podospora appendiculata TaxID=314037 RepID=A0AAE0XFF7_9PEZI|nr:Alpha/beta hydrolase family-domain-containing protein [Podospora appendiculata]
MTSAFDIKEHVVEGQHIREYPHATARSQEDVLRLAVKQYIPKNNPNPQPGDITILASHANGFVKELYEPLWEDMLVALAARGVKVRGIWIADVAWQGQSGLLNDDLLGNDPSWLDHARDLLHLVNTFRAAMPRPIIGVGHSFGANVIVNLALLHPRLLSSLVLLDPVLSRFSLRGPKYGFGPMKNTAYRRDLWPSRAAAEASFLKNAFYSTWDPRVLALWNKHGLVPVPASSTLHPSALAGSITLTTSKHQEVFTYYRPQSQTYDAQTGARLPSDKATRAQHLPDAGPDVTTPGGPGYEFDFYRPEGIQTTDRLPNVRPGVLWVFGSLSDVNPPDVRAEKMELTGVGVGGSGGVKAGRVKAETIEGFGHLVPMEQTTRCAELAADFVADDLRVWRDEDAAFRVWAGRSKVEKTMIDDDWKRWMGPVARREKKL